MKNNQLKIKQYFIKACYFHKILPYPRFPYPPPSFVIGKDGVMNN